MNIKVKIAIYAVLVILAIWFGIGFSRAKGDSDQSAANRLDNDLTSVSVATPPSSTPPATNPVTATNTAAGAITNEVAQPIDPASPTDTNLVAAITNSVTATNAVAPTNQASENVQPATPSPIASQPQTETEPTKKPRKANTGKMIAYLGGFIAVIAVLGLMIARDASEIMATKGVDFLFNDDGVGIKNPEYELAEQTWAAGDHLEAIRMMRAYLEKNPREQFVAIRIAEIYEKDLGNNLAAALEYEEVLKNKLPPDRWGWAAVHLCNLYNKLGKKDQMMALLNRIVSDYGTTPAAAKARKRLAVLEGKDPAEYEMELAASAAQEEAAAAAAEEAEEPVEAPPPEPPKSNLPPGFRPKKS